MTHLAMQLPGVADLARAAGRPVAIFDLESTSFSGAKNFGITELAFCKVSPTGEQTFFETLVNPENFFPDEVQILTGISEREVLPMAPFSRWAEPMRRLMEECLFVGFNARASDIPGLCSQMLRYGAPLPRAGLALDLRDAWRGIVRPERGRGKLIDVATHYGCPFTGAHRAMADVKGTAMALDAMLQRHGVGALRAFETATHVDGKASAAPAAMAAPAKEKAVSASRAPRAASAGSDRAPRQSRDAQKKLARAAVLSILGAGVWDEQKAAALGHEPAAISFAIADLLAEGVVLPNQVATEEAQLWLGQRWEQISEGANGYLKPMLQKAQSLGAPQSVDYIQLRVALLLSMAAPAFAPPRPRGPVGSFGGG
jgi:DNA polymerase III epsilon subunit-like protein